MTQRFGNLADGFLRRVVTVELAEKAERLDLDCEHRKADAVAPGPAKFAFQAGDEVAAIGEAGRRVLAGAAAEQAVGFLQHCLPLLAGGDVAQGEHSPGTGGNTPGIALHPDPATAVAAHPKRHGGAALPGTQPVQQIANRVLIVLDHQVPQVGAR
jgi:hypothetical protein